MNAKDFQKILPVPRQCNLFDSATDKILEDLKLYNGENISAVQSPEFGHGFIFDDKVKVNTSEPFGKYHFESGFFLSYVHEAKAKWR